MSKSQSAARGFLVPVMGILLSAIGSSSALAQEIRYSWMEVSYMSQDVDAQGTQMPLAGQTVDVDASDGNGVGFRASFGPWKNLYLFLDYGSTDINVAAVVTNNLGVFPANDEFDFTTIRGGIGLRYSLRFDTDLYAEVSYDSMDFDFGSFAGENFDMSEQDIGGAIGIRKMFGDDLELRAYGRYTSVQGAQLNALAFGDDLLVGVGFGYTVIRGLSIVGDYESGDLSNWSIGFRLDLDED